MSESKLQEFVRFASPLGGMLLLDKDMEWTSFDVVKKVRSLLHVKKSRTCRNARSASNRITDSLLESTDEIARSFSGAGKRIRGQLHLRRYDVQL